MSKSKQIRQNQKYGVIKHNEKGNKIIWSED